MGAGLLAATGYVMSVEAHANMPGTRLTRVSQHQPQAGTTGSGISKRLMFQQQSGLWSASKGSEEG